MAGRDTDGRNPEDLTSAPEAKRMKVGSKRNRQRKKHLYQAIVKQMEFYLGDANMSRSAFLKEKTLASPWVSLSLFLTFNKMVGMLQEYFGRSDTTDDLWHSLKCISSEILEIREHPESGDREVKRKKPLADAIRASAGEESRTIYVERLPPNVTIEMLQALFQKHGEVVYVSLPKYKHNQAVKGFAFVEFKEESGVKKALEAYIEAKRRISNLLDPSELQSIKSYHIEQEEIGKDNAEGENDNKKAAEKSDETSNENIEKNDDVDNSKKTVENEVENSAASGPETEPETGEASTKDDTKTKKKRKRKRRENDAHQQHNHGGSDPLTMLQIMPKSEWKRLRNKYLNLQRKNVAHTKMKMRQYLEKKKARDNKVIKFTADENGCNDDAVEDTEAEGGKKVTRELEFIPGVIVKFLVDEPIGDEKKVKQRIKAAVMEQVNYVDAKVGASEYFVRCANPDQAKTLANAKALGNGAVLSDQDEKDYWIKISKDREDKVKGKVQVKAPQKKRGKMRIIKKYNSHKFFDDEDGENAEADDVAE